MPSRPLPDPTPITPADGEETGDRAQRMLAELSQMGRDLAGAIERYAAARLAAAGEGDASGPQFDHTAALAGIARTIRLNDALAARLAVKLKPPPDRPASEKTDTRRRLVLMRKAPAGATLH